MGQVWYYQIDGREHGPVNAHQLLKLAATGQLHSTSLVRRNTTENWFVASRVRELFDRANNAGGVDTDHSKRWLILILGGEHGPYSDKEIKQPAKN